jgi:arginine decarboxylase-like protein
LADDLLGFRLRLEAQDLGVWEAMTGEQRKLSVVGPDIDYRSEVVLERHVLVLDRSRDM